MTHAVKTALAIWFVAQAARASGVSKAREQIICSDAEALAAKLGELIGDPGRARHMGSLGRRKVLDKFAAGVIVPKIEALYGSFQR